MRTPPRSLLVCALALTFALGAVAPAAGGTPTAAAGGRGKRLTAPARRARPPRIVSARMIDADRDARADRVRVTYSVRVRHARDRDGRYPFVVAGYRIRSVGKARRKTLVIVLTEKTRPDPGARPAIRYRRTRSRPVRARTGKQAARQRFRATRPHRHALPPVTPPPATTPPPTTGQADTDRDGTPDANDCAPRDPAIHPGAPDLPDLGFVDSNCDGIDGTETDAIFVSPAGRDRNPGTKAKPKRQIQAAVAAAAGQKKSQVLVAFGTYDRVELSSAVGIYGGYDATSWKRQDRYPDGLPLILGSPEGMLVQAAKDVVLQHLAIRGASSTRLADRSAYGIRAIDGARLTLQRVNASAGDGARGLPGIDGRAGAPGGRGKDGAPGACDSDVDAPGGAGGVSAGGLPGGDGGDGHYESDGGDGAPGAGGAAGQEGEQVHQGDTPLPDFIPATDPPEDGVDGEPGLAGTGGTNAATFAAASWRGEAGIAGMFGFPGGGGGGGGAGGGETGPTAINGTGNGGGGGGGGGAGGQPGRGGQPGGGSFGIYLFGSSVVVEGSSITAGAGGRGGRGGDGGLGGVGGRGGHGGSACTGDVGAGGDGERGGHGGRGGGGGGGAGGPSIAIFELSSSATVKDSKVIARLVGGPGGLGGAGGPGGAGARGLTKQIAAEVPVTGTATPSG